MTRDQLKQLEADLWSAADNLRANSDLKSSEYSTPVLGLIFLKFADNNYRRHEAEIIAEYQKLRGIRLFKPQMSWPRRLTSQATRRPTVSWDFAKAKCGRQTRFA
jgi:type I restriction-modification system DNA methylase subunit